MPPTTDLDSPHDEVSAQDLERCLQQLMTAGVPGISVAVGTGEGVIWQTAVGCADIQRQIPLAPTHVLGIGSITKVLVATVILQLSQNHRDLLECTPASVLGDAVIRGIANADRATLRQLLSHTSGIPSWEDDPRWIKAGRGVDLDVQRSWGETEPLEYIRGHAPLFEPGTGYSYSNTNHTLLGLVIEALTGEPSATQIRRRILQPLALHSMYLEGFEPAATQLRRRTLQPLGLHSTYLEGFEPAATQIRRRILQPLALHSTYLEGFEPAAPMPVPCRYHYSTPQFIEAAGINERFAPVRPTLIDVSTSNLSVEWTAGGMLSTAADLSLFGLALRTGQLLSAESMRLLTAWAPADETSEVGLGVFRFALPRGALIGHTGNVLGFSSCLCWDPLSDAVVAVCTNVGSMHAGEDAMNAGRIALRSPFTPLVRRFMRQRGRAFEG